MGCHKLAYHLYSVPFLKLDYGSSARHGEALTGYLPIENQINTFQNLATDKLVMKEAGFLDIFVNNDAQTPVYYDNVMVTMVTGTTMEINAYYPSSKILSNFTTNNWMYAPQYNHYKYNAKERQTELGLEWLDYGARMMDPVVGRWWWPDPMAERHYNWSLYAYCYGNPINLIDPFGKDTVWFLDQATRPESNSAYTATIYLERNKRLIGPYTGSSFPDNDEARTLKEGEHQYNNLYGHASGSRRGLNLVNENGERISPSTETDSEGNDIPMTTVNVHDSFDGNRRWSDGCPTVPNSDPDGFFNNFDWSRSYNGYTGNTGNSTGLFILMRGENANVMRQRIENRFNPITRIAPIRPSFLSLPTQRTNRIR